MTAAAPPASKADPVDKDDDAAAIGPDEVASARRTLAAFRVVAVVGGAVFFVAVGAVVVDRVVAARADAARAAARAGAFADAVTAKSGVHVGKDGVFVVDNAAAVVLVDDGRVVAGAVKKR